MILKQKNSDIFPVLLESFEKSSGFIQTVYKTSEINQCSGPLFFTLFINF